MEISDIECKIESLFNKTFQIDFNAMSREAKNEELLSFRFRLKARDLLTLLFDIEREFKISIPEDDIQTGKFNTFNNIVNLAYEQIKLKDMRKVV